VALKLISPISSERREDGRAAAKKLARTQRTPLFESQITKSGVQLDGDGTLHHFWRVAGKTHCSNSRTQLNLALIPEKTCDMETFSFVPLSLGGGAAMKRIVRGFICVGRDLLLRGFYFCRRRSADFKVGSATF
jgi:hypothetical protein